MNDYRPALLEAMAAVGIEPETVEFRITESIQRFRSKGDHQDNSWYVLHLHEEIVVGSFGCWKRCPNGVKFCSVSRDRVSPQQWAEIIRRQKLAEAARDAEKKANWARVRDKCRAMFTQAPADDHPYLKKKGIVPRGVRVISREELTPGWLAVALQDAEGAIHNAQFIADDGTKRFHYQGRVQGCFVHLSADESTPYVICEGYATGCSIQAATGWEVACATSRTNLKPVAAALRQKYPHRLFVLAADNDQFTEDNPGLTDARAAAKAIAGFVAFPEFGDEAMADKPTDFNDLHVLEGLGAVKSAILACFPVHGRPIGGFQTPPPDDPSELIRYRYLCEGGSLLINGPTGTGKSSFVLQAFALWSNGLPFFNLQPTRKMTCLLIQAENDDGDMAQMRDGIATGCGFTKEQRQTFFANVCVISHAGLTGRRFCAEIIAPALAIHRPNFLCIDPALSYIGGDVKEQKIVGEFLRVYLNPLLFAHRCACVIGHHTNKPPTGQEKPAWLNGEFSYLGSGSSEWANWARAILSMRSTGQHGFFWLHAAKRGHRLPWPNPDQEHPHRQTIAWSKDKNIICWEMSSDDKIPASGRGRPKFDLSKITQFIAAHPLRTKPWCKIATEELGISSRSFYNYRDDLISQGRIFQSSEGWNLHQNGPSNPASNDP